MLLLIDGKSGQGRWASVQFIYGLQGRRAGSHLFRTLRHGYVRVLLAWELAAVAQIGIWEADNLQVKRVEYGDMGWALGVQRYAIGQRVYQIITVGRKESIGLSLYWWGGGCEEVDP